LLQNATHGNNWRQFPVLPYYSVTSKIFLPALGIACNIYTERYPKITLAQQYHIPLFPYIVTRYGYKGC